jgi:putative transposase
MRAPFTQIYIHLVWSTWNREPLITNDVTERLYAAVAKRCIQNKCNPIAIGGIEDHLHLLVRLNPAIAVADLVKDVKGSTSHLMNHEIRPEANFRWQGAYGAFSIRKDEVDQVKAYVLGQAEHHGLGTVFGAMETTEITT